MFSQDCRFEENVWVLTEIVRYCKDKSNRKGVSLSVMSVCKGILKIFPVGDIRLAYLAFNLNEEL